jgi:hypothetical protein
MILGAIALKLRSATTDFENRIAGAAELDLAIRNTLRNEMAFVIPLTDDANINVKDASVNQLLTERFAVIVAIAADASQKDKTGIGAYDRLHDIRGQIFKPLIGWDQGFEGLIYYRGGRLLEINRGYLWWQFEFEYTSRISVHEDGYGFVEETTVDDIDQDLPYFDKLYAQYLMWPSVKWRDLKRSDYNIELPDDVSNPDMAQLIDFSDNPLEGGYDTGYSGGFETNKQ